MISKNQSGQAQHRASKFCLWHRLCKMGYASRHAENLADSIAEIYNRTGELKIPGPPGRFDSPEKEKRTVLRSRSEKERRKIRRRDEAADYSRSGERRRARESSRRSPRPRARCTESLRREKQRSRREERTTRSFAGRGRSESRDSCPSRRTEEDVERGRKGSSRKRGKCPERAADKPKLPPVSGKPAVAKAGTAGQAGEATAAAAAAVKQEPDSSYSYYSSSDEQAKAPGEEVQKVKAASAAAPRASSNLAPAAPAPTNKKSKAVDKTPAAAAEKKPNLQLDLEQRKELMNSFLSTAIQEVMK